MLNIAPIPAFKDNYIWCLWESSTGKALIVDPGQADPVTEFLEKQELSLDIILLTHHHPDHTGGVAALTKNHNPGRIIGPADSPFKAITNPVHAGDEVIWNGMTFNVLAVPGHTLDHIAFYSSSRVNDEGVLFCGDTLFVCGCGRLFEGTPDQMRQSLDSLRQLPEKTAVYCAHEYTLTNIGFARSLLPDDQNLAEFEAECEAKRRQKQPTVPSSVGSEKRLNPFLRWDDPEVAKAAQAYARDNGLPAGNEDDIFAAIRHGKDHF